MPVIGTEEGRKDVCWCLVLLLCAFQAEALRRALNLLLAGGGSVAAGWCAVAGVVVTYRLLQRPDAALSPHSVAPEAARAVKAQRAGAVLLPAAHIKLAAGQAATLVGVGRWRRWWGGRRGAGVVGFAARLFVAAARFEAQGRSREGEAPGAGDVVNGGGWDALHSGRVGWGRQGLCQAGVVPVCGLSCNVTRRLPALSPKPPPPRSPAIRPCCECVQACTAGTSKASGRTLCSS